ncbi:MAG: hypothetical protein ACE5JQ_00060 [Candidatus Methylomirabilales bacterium]
MSETQAGGVMERGELEKLTATKLREFCMEKYPEIQGVSGMKKEEIIEAIIAEEVRLGLRPKSDALRQKAQVISDFKAQIRTFKRQRDQALAAQDHQALREARARMKRLKRQIRRLRQAL